MKFLLSLLIAILLNVEAFAQKKVWDELSPLEQRNRFVQTALSIQAKPRLMSRKDCSGYIESILTQLNFKPFEFASSHPQAEYGVRLIYNFMERVGRVFTNRQQPQIGDFIFFSMTYDKNRNRKYDDELTHMGIIQTIDNDQTISFLHLIRGKVIASKVNLTKPNDTNVNDYIRRELHGHNQSAPKLTSELFSGFGSLIINESQDNE